MAKVDKNLRRVSAEGYFFGSRTNRKTLSTAKNTAGEEVSIAFTFLNNTEKVYFYDCNDSCLPARQEKSDSNDLKHR